MPSQWEVLLARRRLIALRIAQWAVRTAAPDASDPARPQDALNYHEDIEELVVVEIALLLKSGLSWDAIAVKVGDNGITRQSLHRRYGRAANDLLATTARPDRAAPSDEFLAGDSHIVAVWFGQGVEFGPPARSRAWLPRLRAVFEDWDGLLREGARRWEARRSEPGWWRREENE